MSKPWTGEWQVTRAAVGIQPIDLNLAQSQSITLQAHRAGADATATNGVITRMEVLA